MLLLVWFSLFPLLPDKQVFAPYEVHQTNKPTTLHSFYTPAKICYFIVHLVRIIQKNEYKISVTSGLRNSFLLNSNT